jgi:hypothetical protein
MGVLVVGGSFAVGLTQCGDDDDELTEAQRRGVGRACAANDECPEDEDTGERLTCLTNFKSGYCGKTGCANDNDCPNGSACVVHEGTNYCFLICIDKPECNRHRPLDAEANCSSNIEFADGDKTWKTCVPPSG